MNRIKTYLAAAVAFFTTVWELREEQIGASTCFCIYRHRMGRVALHEQWSTLGTAGGRLIQLQGKPPTGATVHPDRIARAVALVRLQSPRIQPKAGFTAATVPVRYSRTSPTNGRLHPSRRRSSNHGKTHPHRTRRHGRRSGCR